MISKFQNIVCNQYEAALVTVQRCIDQCPDERWQKPIVNNPFSQSVFHCLFFADLYLCQNIESQPQQEFHRQHADVFAGYEQLADGKPQSIYERDFIQTYLQFCLQRSQSVVESETEDELFVALAGFPWLSHLLRSEVHLYNIRHIQHHAAQLVGFLRKEAGIEIGWVKSKSD